MAKSWGVLAFIWVLLGLFMDFEVSVLFPSSFSTIREISFPSHTISPAQILLPDVLLDQDIYLLKGKWYYPILQMKTPI